MDVSERANDSLGRQSVCGLTHKQADGIHGKCAVLGHKLSNYVHEGILSLAVFGYRGFFSQCQEAQCQERLFQCGVGASRLRGLAVANVHPMEPRIAAPQDLSKPFEFQRHK
jgi:hypothetical protein